MHCNIDHPQKDNETLFFGYSSVCVLSVNGSSNGIRDPRKNKLSIAVIEMN